MTRVEDGKSHRDKGNKRKVILVYMQTYSYTLLIKWIYPFIQKMNPSKYLDIVIIKVNQENGCIYGTCVCMCVCVYVSGTQSCLTLCNATDCSQEFSR